MSAEMADAMFREFAETRRRRTRNKLVEAHIGFANHVARRYSNRGIADEDLRQVALHALVKAVDRFDPDYGAAFTSFAQTISLAASWIALTPVCMIEECTSNPLTLVSKPSPPLWPVTTFIIEGSPTST